jgi:hypothetical protein
MASTNNKEGTMMSIATHKLMRLAVSISAVGGLLAASAVNGHYGWSDERLKQQIEPIASPLEKLKAV